MMKKYARLRQECSEFDNALFDATPEGSFTESQSRVPVVSAGGSPQRGDTAVRSTHSTGAGLTLTGALKKLGSFREVAGASRRHSTTTTVSQQQPPCTPSAWNDGPRSARWASSDLEDASQSGRWANAETASLSGRWGSVSTTDQYWDEMNSFRDSSRQDHGEPSTAPSKPSQPGIQRQSSLRDAAVPEVTNPGDNTFGAALQQNISMKETQGWLASVKRPLQPRKTRSTRDDPNEFNWRAATSTTSRRTSGAVSQSMRYDRLKTIDLVGESNPTLYDDEASHCNHTNGSTNHVMQKAASMREGGVHSGAIMAMARAYSEKHGVPQAILDCVSCGRELGVIVQGNPRNVDASFCQSCRPHGWTFLTKAPETNKAKRKGMMHFCKKILRIGKKPNKSKG